MKSSSGYEIYHNTLSSVLDEVERYVQSKGYEVGDYFPLINHVSYGSTERTQLEMLKDGRIANTLAIQIYRLDSGKYELNCYPVRKFALGGGVNSLKFAGGGVADNISLEKIKEDWANIKKSGYFTYERGSLFAFEINNNKTINVVSNQYADSFNHYIESIDKELNLNYSYKIDKLIEKYEKDQSKTLPEKYLYDFLKSGEKHTLKSYYGLDYYFYKVIPETKASKSSSFSLGGGVESNTEKLILEIKKNSFVSKGIETTAKDGSGQKYRYDHYKYKANSAPNWIVLLFDKCAKENGKPFATQFNYKGIYSIHYDRNPLKNQPNGKIGMSELVLINSDGKFATGGKITFKKNTNNPNFITINIEYEIIKGSPMALGKQTMSGQMSQLSAKEAYKKGLEIGKKLELKYNIEDIEVTDLENGIIQVFAVSNDFVNMPISELQKFKNGGGIKSIKIGDKFHYKFDGKDYEVLGIENSKIVLSPIPLGSYWNNKEISFSLMNKWIIEKTMRKI